MLRPIPAGDAMNSYAAMTPWRRDSWSWRTATNCCQSISAPYPTYRSSPAAPPAAASIATRHRALDARMAAIATGMAMPGTLVTGAAMQMMTSPTTSARPPSPVRMRCTSSSPRRISGASRASLSTTRPKSTATGAVASRIIAIVAGACPRTRRARRYSRTRLRVLSTIATGRTISGLTSVRSRAPTSQA